MNKVLGVIFSMLLTVSFIVDLSAQNFTHSIQTDTAFCAAELASDHAYSTIVNNSNDSLTIDVLRVEFDNLSNWANAMCVDTICYYASEDSVRVKISPQSSISFRSGFILLNEETTVTAMARFQLRNVEDSNEILEFETYGVNLVTFTSTNSISVSDRINIYPNPTQNILHIESQIKIENIAMFSIQGELLLSTRESLLNLDSFAPGMYWAEIRTGEGIAIKKIVKQ